MPFTFLFIRTIHLAVLPKNLTCVIYCFMQCRIELEKTRLLVLEAADQLDRFGNKKARGTIAMAKVIIALQFEMHHGIVLFTSNIHNINRVKWFDIMWSR